jgi:hypothetical protein
MKLLFCTLISFLFLPLQAHSCDFTQPDKIKHIQVSKSLTIIIKKTVQYPLMITRPLKYLVGEKLYVVFPENYLPHIVAASSIFLLGALKEVPYDLLRPGGEASYCDLCADCIGIKEGLCTK